MKSTNLRTLLALVVVAVTGALALGVASANAAPAANPSATHLCHLAEAYPKGSYVKKNCIANPIFAKTVCSKFLPAMQAMAPGTSFGPAYFPSWSGTEVSCFYKVGSRGQAFSIGIHGGLSHSNTKSGLPLLTLPQSMQFMFDDYTKSTTDMGCPWPSMAEKNAAGIASNGLFVHAPVRTTIDGYKAFTLDQCKTPDSSMAGEPWNSTWSRSIEVVAGHALIVVQATAPFVDVTPDQMMPLVKQLIKTYHNS
jgi:hypothetical protein